MIIFFRMNFLKSSNDFVVKIIQLLGSNVLFVLLQQIIEHLIFGNTFCGAEVIEAKLSLSRNQLEIVFNIALIDSIIILFYK